MDESSFDSKSGKNYELLIRLDEQMKNLTREVRDMSNGIEKRIAVVELGKVSKEELGEVQKNISKEITSTQNDSNKIHDDHEQRLRIVEKQLDEIITKLKTWGAICAIGLALLEIILKLI